MNEPVMEAFDSDDFFRNDFLEGEGDEEVGAGLDRSGQAYLSGGEKLRRQALRWLSRTAP